MPGSQLRMRASTHTNKFTPVGDAYIHIPVSDKIGFREYVTEILNTRQHLRMYV